MPHQTGLFVVLDTKHDSSWLSRMCTYVFVHGKRTSEFLICLKFLSKSYPILRDLWPDILVEKDTKGFLVETSESAHSNLAGKLEVAQCVFPSSESFLPDCSG